MKLTKFRIFAFLLALLLCLSLVACGGNENESDTVDETETGAEEQEKGGVKVGDVVTVGSYCKTTGGAAEALSWQVLSIEEGRALLITSESIDYKPFDSGEYVKGEEYNWQFSTLRSWLNGTFYETVFTDEEKGAILNGGSSQTVAISTSANPMTDLGACSDTYDKVFLLSAEEAETLFADDEARSAGATSYAVDNGVRVKGGKAAFWLRTMGEDANRVAVVLHDGRVDLSGYQMGMGSAGVRPCIWMELDTAYTDDDPVVAFADAKAGDRVTFGSYEQDGNEGNGAEAIVWRVLEAGEDRLMLISEDCLAAHKYYAALSSVTWNTSTLRKWLNGGFFGDAFTEEQQAQILITNLTTEANPNTGVSGGAATEDQVFVLSAQEIMAYFPEQKDRVAKATPYAKADGVFVDTNFGNAEYWTRTAGEDEKKAAYVLYYGDISYEGTQVRSDYIGVRPVIWVKK